MEISERQIEMEESKDQIEMEESEDKSFRETREMEERRYIERIRESYQRDIVMIKEKIESLRALGQLPPPRPPPEVPLYVAFLADIPKREAQLLEMRNKSGDIIRYLSENEKEVMKQHWHMSSSGGQQRSYMDVMRNKETRWVNVFDKDYWKKIYDEEEKEEYHDADDEGEALDSFCLKFALDPKFNQIDVPGAAVHTAQICSLKLTKEGMNSVEVYGLIHVYSQTGFDYQVIFNRNRNNPQTLTQKDPCLLLTGPTLPPLALPHRVMIQGTLKLKSTTESEDKYLSVSICCADGKVKDIQKMKDFQDNIETDTPFVCTKQYIELPYLLELTRSLVIFSTVATISVQVINRDVPLPDCCFTACTDITRGMEAVLLDSRDGKDTLIKGNIVKGNMVQLSRRTICVESGGLLIFNIKHGNLNEELKFSSGKFMCDPPTEEDTLPATVGVCKIKVGVKWSDYSDWRNYNDVIF